MLTFKYGDYIISTPASPPFDDPNYFYNQFKKREKLRQNTRSRFNRNSNPRNSK